MMANWAAEKSVKTEKGYLVEKISNFDLILEDILINFYLYKVHKVHKVNSIEILFTALHMKHLQK